MHSFHSSQLSIAKRTIGSWLGKSGRISTVKIDLVDAQPTVWQYRVEAWGYNINLYIYSDGHVKSELFIFGRTACTSSTLAGFCSLIKNCKRWAEGSK